MATVPNSQVRNVTFNWSGLWLKAATRHGERESRRLRPWKSSTRHGDSDSQFQFVSRS